jgi:protein-S-isoprenylcysteine O-methyltransferase Ste14
MSRILLFLILSLPITFFSWKTFFNFHTHGFYRFFCWECIAWLTVSNYTFWFIDPFTLKQLISWVLLIISVFLVISGVISLKRKGKQGKDRNDKSLFQFEQTTVVISTGIFKYIRHPLYSSLLFLTWGIFFKHITVELGVVAALSSIFLWFTALFDEKECISFFGESYSAYMKKSKRFIPFIL